MRSHDLGGLITLCLVLAFGLGWLGPAIQPSSASEWQTTEALLGGSFDQLKANSVNTRSWTGQLNLRLQRQLQAGRQMTFDANWGYGEVRDVVAHTRSVSPDLIDLDIKLLQETTPPFSFFVSTNYVSDHDLKPGVLGLGVGYQARLASNFTADLSLQGTKDITSGLNPEAGYRVALSYNHPFFHNLQIWTDARSQGTFETSDNRQDFLEIRALYQLASRLNLTLIQRLENPLKSEVARKTNRLLIAYDMH